MIHHPFERIRVGGLRYWQIFFCFVTLCFVGALIFVLPAREHDTLLDLAEAGSASGATTVLASWSPQERIEAAFVVGFDFLMNPAYMNALAISCIWSGRILSSPIARSTAAVLAWLAWSVVATNIAENAGLYIALTSSPREPWPWIVAAAHMWASGVIVATVGFSLFGLVHRFRTRARRA